MPKGPQGQKPPKFKKLPEGPVSPAVAITRRATNQDVGDTADRITRAPRTNG